MYLLTQDEVDLWKESMRRYVDDYNLIQQNDLILVGAALTQQLLLFRAQITLSGMAPETDHTNMPTGRYIAVTHAVKVLADAQRTIESSTTQIQAIEKGLGIDKKTREQGGQHTVQNYVTTLKAIGREYGLHIQQRVKNYEAVMMEARWKLRVLRNADAEDRAYHNITPDTICTWLEVELDKLEQEDKKFATSVHKLYVGKV